jgi:poly-gamma-glutamate synthesis protein (capsule biosynthesis protein)
LKPSNKSYIRPSKGITRSGKLFIWGLNILYLGLEKLTKLTPSKPREFEENPKFMSLKDVLFLGYKYYGRNIHGGHTLNNPLPLNKDLFWSNGCKKSNTVSIHIGGDLMPYKFINKKTCVSFWDSSQDFFDADFVMGNLESPIDLSKPCSLVPEVMIKDMNFNCSEEQFKVFNGPYKGFDALSIANNHSLDMGYDGLQSTINFLKKRRIHFCGAGTHQTSFIKEIKGMKVGFMSYTFSLNQFSLDSNNALKINHGRFNLEDYNIDEIKSEAMQLKRNGAKYILLMLHVGNAYQPYPSPVTQNLFKRIAQETEVDFIAGHHPHNIQGIEQYNVDGKVKIGAYSLGDFVAYDVYQRSHLNMYIKLELEADGDNAIASKVTVNLNYLDFSNNQLKLIPFKDARVKYANSPKIKDLELLCKQTLGVEFN